MLRTRFAFLFCLIVLGLEAQSVPGACGTSLEDQLQFRPRLLENKKQIAGNQEGGALHYIPVYFHLVADSEGNGRIGKGKAMESICQLNNGFAETNFRFYLAEHDEHGLFDESINSDNVYTQQTNLFAMHSRRHLNAVNVYIVNTPVANNNQPGITLAYYSPGYDWIVCRKDQISGSASVITLPHEMGHFFSLNHTFLGYENNPFDAQDATWPNAPTNSPSGIATERVNGSNCSSAGDAICDTPPDYNFGFLQNGCTAYTGGANDPLGVPVDPQENNYMGYFTNCAGYVFTPDQTSVMESDYNHPFRANLQNNYVPNGQTINTPANLLTSPVSGATVNTYNNVYFNWQSVSGASHYLLEIDVLPTFGTVFSKSYITQTNGFLVQDLEPNKNYHWRVRPFNLEYGCASYRQTTFKTGGTTSVQSIPDLEAWQISPNPIRQGAQVRIDWQLKRSQEIQMRILDLSGRVVVQTNLNGQAGANQQFVPTQDLPVGNYFISLLASGGVDTRKLLILR
ncbi:MAG: T9SS type A sorting domain-containing protein [Saprospiraceae bacterium]